MTLSKDEGTLKQPLVQNVVKAVQTKDTSIHSIVRNRPPAENSMCGQEAIAVCVASLKMAGTKRGSGATVQHPLVVEYHCE